MVNRPHQKAIQRNRQYTQPIPVGTEILTGYEIVHQQKPFPVSVEQFQPLKHGSHILEKGIEEVFVFGVGASLAILTKIAVWLYGIIVSVSTKGIITPTPEGAKLDIQMTDWIVIVAACTLIVVLLAVSKVFPSERQKVLTDMQRHFEKT